MGEGESDMEIRLATMDDAETLFEWANDPITRAGSHSAEPIEWDTHVAWLERAIENPDRRLWIGVEDDEPVGQVRLDREGDKEVISTTIAPEARGRGLSEPMMELACQQTDLPIEAEIKHENVRSIRMCVAIGFVEVARDDEQVVVVRPGRQIRMPRPGS